ncbi:ArsB/NhaD family transporter [Lutispora saccharofermentans]|uniref:Citrate transporter-like domain-containing protein n=1 Tax=Lutispora saccharofermentans TaxID=3024236 RepID=A0ABT1NC36_9FIRM|nr:SLC13 family permease [Lutispora saccharofermentans]MCQ1528824.1 hypothetical protein [Lutispora saccharofermentans]
MLNILMIASVTYLGMVFFTKYRTPIAVLGSAILLIYGNLSGSFPANLAFQNFPQEIVILIIVLGLFTKIFERSGLFNYIGYQFVRYSKKKRILIVILLPIVMYATSLFMNNLTVILLFTFICLKLALKFNLPIIPLLVSAIIASNIGGAALPWADTPAVIITLYTDFSLWDFLIKLFIPCFIYTILLVKYSMTWFNYLEKKKYPSEKQTLLTRKGDNNVSPLSLDRKLPADTSVISYVIKPKLHEDKAKPIKRTKNQEIQLSHYKRTEPSEELSSDINKIHYTIKPKPHDKEPPPIKKHKKLMIKTDPFDTFEEAHMNINWKKAKLPLVLFFLFITFICIGPFINLSIAFISVIFGSILLITNDHNPEDTINAIPVLDSLIFIVALFLIGGVLEYSGILNIAVNYVLTFTEESGALILISIMLMAFIIATFLSAGPAAATLLPICNQLSSIVGNNLVYAALALGILAGSSMLPWSATGGPVLLGEVTRFLKLPNLKMKDKKSVMEIFDLKHYLAFSIPFSLIMVVLNALILILYLKIF